MIIATTNRLILRRFTIADAPFILQLVNDPTWIQYIGDRNVHTLSDARAYLENGSLASYKKHGFGFYLVERQEDGMAMGMCGLIKRPFLADVDIGYAMLPHFAGRGYAFEAATAVLAHARTDFGFNRIVAVTAVDNDRSIHLLQKLGFAFEGRIAWGGHGEEVNLYGIELSD